MKNSNYFLVLIIIVLIILVFYQQSKISEKGREISNLELAKKTQEDSIEKSAKTVSVLGYESINDKILIIDSFAAKDMVRAFVKEQAKFRNPSTPDHADMERSVYFKYEYLKNYIKDNIGASDEVGLRIYYGKYDYNSSNVKEYLKKKLGDENSEPYKKFKERYEKRISVILALTDSDGKVIKGKELLNLGGLCPPDCLPTNYFTADPLYHD